MLITFTNNLSPDQTWQNTAWSGSQLFAIDSILKTFFFLKNNHKQGCSQNAEKLRTSKGDYLIKQWFSSIVSLFKMGTSLKERICSQRERIHSFNSSSLWYGKSLYHIRWSPLNVVIFIRHVHNWVMGATPKIRLQKKLVKLPNMPAES